MTPMDPERIKLLANVNGLRMALERIWREAADTSRDGDARKLEAQLSFIAGAAEDALSIWK